MKCNGCEAKGEYGCRAGFISIVINGEMGCEDADRALAAFRAKDKVGMTIYPSRKDHKLRPISRADNIRAMTDEELAEWFASMVTNANDNCPDKHGYKLCLEDGCTTCWLDWLRQEVTDEHYHSWG